MWGWIERLKQFVVTATNRMLGRDAVTSVSHLNVSVTEDAVSGVTEVFLSDGITIDQYESTMREIMKDGTIQQYLLGRGGMAQLTFFDYGSVGGMLGEQYRYFSGFISEIMAGNLSPGQIRMRAAMYARATGEGYQRAKMRAHGLPEGALPAIPRDGSSCYGLTNCRCDWDIQDVEDDDGNIIGWDCTWQLGASDACGLCVDHSLEWNPFHIEAPVPEEA